jgi:DNA polymerase-3 subunit epsilon
MDFISKIDKLLKLILGNRFGLLKDSTFDDPNSIRFVVLDTETTGFDYQEDRILCIGAVVLQNNKIAVQDSFEVFIKQDRYNKSSAQIHGILRDSVLDRPDEAESLRQFLKFLGDSIIVAHHTHFDITMINKALERNGMPSLKNKTLDTAKLYKKTLLYSPLLIRKENYSLDELADKFDISKKDRHTALGDAYITAIAFLKILPKIKEKNAFRYGY